MAEEKKIMLKEANELARTLFNSMPYEQRKRLGAPDDRLREINALIEKGDYLSMAHLKKRKKELEDWLIDWYKEICKKSLQVSETCKENPDSFTGLEEAAEQGANKYYADNGYSPFPNTEKSAFMSGFIAGAEWKDGFTHHEINESLAESVARQMEDDGDVDDFVRRGIDDIVLKYAELGAKWQAERLLKGSPMPEDTVIFQKGIEEGKRLMMEDAVECDVIVPIYDGNVWSAEIKIPGTYKIGDKVKIIIVKEE